MAWEKSLEARYQLSMSQHSINDIMFRVQSTCTVSGSLFTSSLVFCFSPSDVLLIPKLTNCLSHSQAMPRYKTKDHRKHGS